MKFQIPSFPIFIIVYGVRVSYFMSWQNYMKCKRYDILSATKL